LINHNKGLEVIYDAIIIGAGISGLSLANELVSQKKNVLTLEKSKSVGGRIATRRDGEAAYDHGAQFYSKLATEFSDFDQKLVDGGIVHTWFQDQDRLHRVAEKGMTRISKHFAKNLQIVFNEKVLMLKDDSNSSVEVTCESGQTFFGKKVFLSSPLPQSLAILTASNISYPEGLNHIQYASSMVGLFETNGNDAAFSDFDYKQDVNQDVFSVANQMSKRVSSIPAFTVVMSAEWSRHNFDKDDATNLNSIAEAFMHFLKIKSDRIQIRKSQLKKWRYSHPLMVYGEPYERVGATKAIYLFGDAFGGGSIRGALRSSQLLSKNLNS
jgi:renalase